MSSALPSVGGGWQEVYWVLSCERSFEHTRILRCLVAMFSEMIPQDSIERLQRRLLPLCDSMLSATTEAR